MRLPPVISSWCDLVHPTSMLSCILTNLNPGPQCGKSGRMQSSKGEYPSRQKKAACMFAKPLGKATLLHTDKRNEEFMRPNGHEKY